MTRLHILLSATWAAVMSVLERIRPVSMTALANILGLAPVMWATGTGADLMKRIAAPMVGGVITSAIMELMIYPALYPIWKWRWEVKPVLTHTGEASYG